MPKPWFLQAAPTQFGSIPTRGMSSCGGVHSHGVGLAALGGDAPAHNVSGAGVEPGVAQLLRRRRCSSKRDGRHGDGGNRCRGSAEDVPRGLIGDLCSAYLPEAEDDAVGLACANEGELGGVEDVEVASGARDYRGATVALDLEGLESNGFTTEALVPARNVDRVRVDVHGRDELVWRVALRLFLASDVAGAEGEGLAVVGDDLAAHGVRGVGEEFGIHGLRVGGQGAEGSGGEGSSGGGGECGALDGVHW